MKPFTYPFLGLLFLSAWFFSCRKSAALSIQGKWLIVNDSTSVTGTGTRPSYHSNYIGVAGDYYDFRADGNMYVKEGAYLDTMAYEVLPGNQVRCTPAPGSATMYNTTALTATTAALTITGPTPEGQLFKSINLKR